MELRNLRCEYLVNPNVIDVPQPRLSWEFASNDPNAKNEQQTAYRITVASAQSDLKTEQNLLWDSGWVKSNQTNQIEYAGQELTSYQRVYWRVRVQDELGQVIDSLTVSDALESAFWQMGIMHPKDWHAHWIGSVSEPVTEVLLTDSTKNKPVPVLQGPPCPLLRKEFTCCKPVKSAFLYATAMGEYEARLNGQRVGDRYFTPEWTDYAKRVYYQVYDVSNQIHSGDNCLGAILGDGWYLGFLGPGDKIRQRYYGNARKYSCMLRITFEDDSIEEICTDETWQLYEDGPIRKADHFMGATLDFTKDIPGWDNPTIDTSKWIAATIDKTIQIIPQAQRHEPVNIFTKIKPIAITEPKRGVYIINMGQNMVGWVELTIPRELIGSENRVQVRHGEMLELNGTLHTENLRLAAQTDLYLLPPGGTCLSLSPKFTFHGFQYVEITGLTKKPTVDMIIGHAVCSNPPQTGIFECSSPLINQIWKNILWTQRDNMLSVPTDCPQRNERMGWMGDAQVFAQTGIYNLDMAAFFNKYIIDIRDAQGEEGMYPDFAPHPFPTKTAFSFSPGWGDCGVIIPWRLYVAYGDKRVLEEHYESMQKYLDLVQDENPKYLWETWGGNYGDWLHGDTLKARGYPNKGGEMPKDVYATTFYYLSSILMAKIARVLQKDEDSRRYTEVAENVRKAFIATYVDPHGKIKGDTQSCYAIALGFGLLPPELQDIALKHLLTGLKKYKGRLSTGFISTIQMMLELSRRGQNELAYQLIESKKFPSWGYTIEQGATTIWERWDGFVAGRGFQDKGMNSFNHYSIGSVGEWLYSNVLGINFDENHPGMEHIIIQPRPGGSVTYAQGSYRSIRGPIKVEWHRPNDKSAHFKVVVEVPPNTTATVILPSGAQKIGSGHYEFEA
jgi:alpha-L-rhamnosidase